MSRLLPFLCRAVPGKIKAIRYEVADDESSGIKSLDISFDLGIFPWSAAVCLTLVTEAYGGTAEGGHYARALMRKSAIAKMQELDGNGNTVRDKLIKVRLY